MLSAKMGRCSLSLWGVALVVLLVLFRGKVDYFLSYAWCHIKKPGASKLSKLTVAHKLIVIELLKR